MSRSGRYASSSSVPNDNEMLGECDTWTGMARVLFIVARDQPELLASLRETFATQEAAGLVEIFQDRRQGPRESRIESNEFSTHHRDPLRNVQVSRDLQGLGLAVVHRPPSPVLE